MLRGLYTAGTGMLTQRKKMDVITNNIVNAETRGFKQDKLLSRSFEEMLITRINDPAVLLHEREVGPLGTGVHIDEVFTDFLQGALEQTDINTDFAILGDGFFVVNTPEGERYTRNGIFQIDSDSRLVTQEGYPVQGVDGDIYVNPSNFSVREDGIVVSDGAVVGRIRLVSFDDNGTLRKTGNNLYLNFDGGQPYESDALIKQGYTENSNVDLTEQIVNMIEVYRVYETNQRVIRTIDETLGKAVNDIGRV